MLHHLWLSPSSQPPSARTALQAVLRGRKTCVLADEHTTVRALKRAFQWYLDGPISLSLSLSLTWFCGGYMISSVVCWTWFRCEPHAPWLCQPHALPSNCTHMFGTPRGTCAPKFHHENVSPPWLALQTWSVWGPRWPKTYGTHP